MNRKKFLSLSALIIGTLFLNACSIAGINVKRGSGQIITQARDVNGFDEVQIDGAGELVIIQGEQEALEITAEDNIINELTSIVEGNTLVLGYRDKFWRNTIIPTKRITYTLTITNLSRVTINGAADMQMEALETENLSLEINGAGDITIDRLTVDSFDLQISGTSTLEIAGEADQQNINIDGAGNYKAGDLKSNRVEIEINGLGNATVWATEFLSISIDGGGNLRYYGSPNITQDINGFGDIENLGEK